jgi:Icc-related predicted phosphoesterase
MPMIRIVATSDLHGELPKIPPCDLLLLGGDICPDGDLLEQEEWLNTNFRPWLESIPAREVVAVAGNHDLIFENASYLIPKGLRWHYLQDKLIELDGLKIYGTPWQLSFWGAFNLNEEGLAKRYQKIPQLIDIFISHGPPYGIQDEVLMGYSPHHAGSTALRDKILEIKPKLFVYGHIHPAFGVTQFEDIIFANVSLLNDQMEVVNPPVIFDI